MRVSCSPSFYRSFYPTHLFCALPNPFQKCFCLPCRDFKSEVAVAHSCNRFYLVFKIGLRYSIPGFAAF